MGRVTYRIEADKQKAVDAFLAIIDKQKQVEQNFKKTTKASKGSTDQLGSFIKKGAGLLGTAFALTKIIGLFDKIRERARTSAGGIEEAEANFKKLVQISDGSDAKLRGFLDTASQIGRRQGIARNEALGIVFQGASLGFSNKEINTFGSFRGFSRGVSPIIGAVGGLRAALGADVGGGSIRSITNALLVGAKSSKVGVEEIAAEVLTPAQQGKFQGASFEETLAAVSLSAVALKSTPQAATAIKALLRGLFKDRRTKGLGLVGGTKKLLSLPETVRNKIITEDESRVGFGLVTQNLDEIEALVETIKEAEGKTGTEDSKINQALGLSKRFLPIAALKVKQRAKAGRVITEEGKLGINELFIEATQETLREALARGGKGAIAKGIIEGFVDKVATFTSNPDAVAALAEGIIREEFPTGQRGTDQTRFGVGAMFNADPTGENAAIQKEFIEALRESTQALKENAERRRRQNPEAHNEGL